MLYLVVLGLIAIAQAVPAPGHGALEGYCNTEDDCALSECCVRFRRGFSPRDGDVRRFVTGKCYPDDSPRCQRPRPCRRTSDCAADECCVSEMSQSWSQGYGRRRGTCQPMGAQYEECHQINGSGRPGDNEVVQGSCPCLEPWKCGNIISEITDPTLTATCGFFRG